MTHISIIAIFIIDNNRFYILLNLLINNNFIYMGRSLNKSDAVDIDSLFLTEDALPKARNPEGEIITSTEELHSLLKKL